MQWSVTKRSQITLKYQYSQGEKWVEITSKESCCNKKIAIIKIQYKSKVIMCSTRLWHKFNFGSFSDFCILLELIFLVEKDWFSCYKNQFLWCLRMMASQFLQPHVQSLKPIQCLSKGSLGYFSWYVFPSCNVFMYLIIQFFSWIVTLLKWDANNNYHHHHHHHHVCHYLLLFLFFEFCISILRKQNVLYKSMKCKLQMNK